jgi:hypothetical protein
MNMTRVYQIPDVSDVVVHLEEHGGDLMAFLQQVEPDKKMWGQLLSRIRLALMESPDNAQKWDKLIAVGKQVKRDLMEAELCDHAIAEKNVPALKWLVEKQGTFAGTGSSTIANPLLDKMRAYIDPPEDEDGEQED